MEDITKTIHRDKDPDNEKMEEDEHNEEEEELEIENSEIKSDYFTNHVHVGAGLSSIQVRKMFLSSILLSSFRKPLE